MNLYFPPPNNDDWVTTNVGTFEPLIDFAAQHNTDQLVILDHGHLALNATFNGTDHDAADVYAVQKSLFAILIGVAQDKGVLNITDPLHKYLPLGWTKLPPKDEARLTLHHILTMTSGMNDTLEAEGEIGKSWAYNNTAYNYLKRILIEQTGMDLQTLTDTWLLNRLGMSDTHWEDRDMLLPDGRKISGLTMSALDMARLGLLILADGRWDNDVILANADYRRDMLSPGSSANPAWCYFWWRNDQSHFIVPMLNRTVDGPFIPNAPPALRMAMGYGDNVVYIDPTKQRVIARRGRLPFKRGERGNFHRQGWDLLLL